jgi:hypothetical protein
MHTQLTWPAFMKQMDVEEWTVTKGTTGSLRTETCSPASSLLNPGRGDWTIAYAICALKLWPPPMPTN